MTAASLKFTQDTLGHVLDDNWLVVPPYQRAYAWTKDNVRDFWEDLAEALADERDYFIGAIVLTPAGKDFHVIDGQQRLVTASLLLAAIRDELTRLGDDELARDVDETYLRSYHRPTKLVRPKLAIAASDLGFYTDRFLERSGGVPSSESPSQRRMLEAFELLKNEVGGVAQGADDSVRVAALTKWIDHVETRVAVVLVEAATYADAYQIFETLNDRGAPLTIADLLKNHLISLEPDEADRIEQAWSESVSGLGVEVETDDYVTFLRHFWNSHQGAVRERDLYAGLKQEITTGEEAIQLADNLAAASVPYAAILDPSHAMWSESASVTADAVATLVGFQLGQYRPLLLAGVQVFDDEELELLAISLVNWTFRGLIVGGIGGGVAERTYSTAAVRIRKGELQRTSQVFEQLRPIVPTDEQFRSSFETASVSRGRIANYIVRCFERTRSNATDYPALDSRTASTDTIAGRLLPNKANPSQWPGFAPEDMSRFVNRIGNLVAKDRRAEPSFEDWEERREWAVFAGSSPDDSLYQFERWNPESIRVRQQDLAADAVWLWPREFELL